LALLNLKVSNLACSIVMKRSAFFPLLITVLFTVSCHTTYRAENIQYSNYRIQRASADNSIAAIIKPYGDSVNKLMNVVIGFNESLLERKRQGNTLGYFITDAYLEMAKQKMGSHIDAAFMNSGGIRIPDLSAGVITQGKIFELMPFDNLMVLLKVKGSLLKQYIDTLAATDGVIQSGLTMQIINRTAQQVLVGGKPLDMNAEYTIVNSDYVVNNSGLLKNLPRITNGYLLRDAIIDYVKFNDSQGKKIKVSNTDRIIYVN
jgi:2',3'-cyclic-nucleotide 2'-phosphodiesterase (5'-nucleotidase family)